jgi:alkylhydroperoxidase family enzyme
VIVRLRFENSNATVNSVTENVTVSGERDAHSRMAPLEPPYPDGVAELLAGMMPPGVEPIALFRAFARNVAMTSAMREWGAYELGRQLSLTMRDREIVIDRTCARCGCEYEWGVHVAFFADRVGLTAEQVRSLTCGSPADDCWDDDRDRLLIAAADALHDTSDIDDELWTALSGTFDAGQLLDILMLCGWYHAISFCARAARVPLERGSPTFASVGG